MPERIAILGSGAWGLAMSLHLARCGHTIHLVCPRVDTAQRLRQSRQRPELLPGVQIPDTIRIADSLGDCDLTFVAIPTKYLRASLERFQGQSPGHGIVSLTKGLEIGSFARPAEMIAAAFPNRPVAVLSGPSHAEEVARGLPASAVLASEDAAFAQSVQRSAGSESFRVYTSADARGVELAGALKNVLGIAAGVCDGLDLGDNAKAALVTRGLAEMTRFGVALGADPATFAGLAGIGDLMATCFSRHGRNRRAGERIARGESVRDVISGPQIVEGFFTAKSVHERSTHMGLDLPIMRGVYELLYESKPPVQAVRDLMARRQKTEDRW